MIYFWSPRQLYRRAWPRRDPTTCFTPFCVLSAPSLSTGSGAPRWSERPVIWWSSGGPSFLWPWPYYWPSSCFTSWSSIRSNSRDWPVLRRTSVIYARVSKNESNTINRRYITFQSLQRHKTTAISSELNCLSHVL